MSSFIHNCVTRESIIVSYELLSTIRRIVDSQIVGDVYVTCNGQVVGNDECLQEGHVYHICPRLIGGKGGFGSMLRAIGAQIEKTTSREACRDLSGRRMRDVNNEKSMKDWIAKQADREKEREERRRERRERRLALPKHKFEDETYEKQKQEVSEKQNQALDMGLKKMQFKPEVTPGKSCEPHPCRKRKAEATVTSGQIKKQTEWLGVDLENLSDSDTEEDLHSSRKISKITEMKDKSNCQSDGGSVNSDSDVAIFSSEQDDSSRCCPEISEKSSDEKEDQCEDAGNKQTIVETDIAEDRESGNGTSQKHSLLKDLAPLKPTAKEGGPLNLDEFNAVEELETEGLDRLKAALMERGLKCGGTLQERAQRLMSVKGLTREQIDPSLFAKAKSGKNKK